MTATDEVGRSNDAVASITRHHPGVTTVIDTPLEATASLRMPGSVLLHWSVPGGSALRTTAHRRPIDIVLALNLEMITQSEVAELVRGS